MADNSTTVELVSPRVERARRLNDRLVSGQRVSSRELAAVIAELSDDYHRDLVIRTLLAVRELARTGYPHAEIVDMINEALQ